MKVFNELLHLTQVANSDKEYGFVSGNPFWFYGVSLQYCIMMEYAKFLETITKEGNENAAFLFKLNKAALKGNFDLKYNESKKIVKALWKPELYPLLKDLRNKKFTHSDNHPINNPLNIQRFIADKIIGIENQFSELFKVFNSVLSNVKNTSFELDNDTNTANFIKYHAVLKKNYLDNFFEANNNGYGRP